MTNEWFAGQITDFNAWNRPLTVLEIEEFSTGCSDALSLDSNRQWIRWNNLSLTYVGKNTRKINVSRYN